MLNHVKSCKNRLQQVSCDMGFTENVVFSMSTAKASGLLQVDSKRTSSCRNEEINLCMFTLDADCIVEVSYFSLTVLSESGALSSVFELSLLFADWET